jgi:hypothetical protein
LQQYWDLTHAFRDFYNFSRPHQALQGQMPAQIWGAQVNKRRGCKGHRENKEPQECKKHKKYKDLQTTAQKSSHKSTKTPDP